MLVLRQLPYLFKRLSNPLKSEYKRVLTYQLVRMEKNARVTVVMNEMTIEFQHNSVKMKLIRPSDGQLSKTLQRLVLKLNPKSKKKKNAKNQEPANEILLAVKNISGDEISADQLNSEAFKGGNMLHVDNSGYTIHLNPPMIESVELPSSITSGFQVYPTVAFRWGDVDSSQFTWYRSKDYSGKWERVGDNFAYTPTNEDVVHFLKLSCQAGDASHLSVFVEDAVTTTKVAPHPGVCPFDQRHLYTPTYSPTCLRVMSYNILADVFCDSEFGRDVLYPYCPQYALNIHYRQSLLVKEILGFHADVICLQECETKTFEKCLEPVLALHGYQGFLNLKTGVMPEGEALFFRKEKFTHVADKSVSIKEALDLPCNAQLLAALQQNPLLEELRGKHAIAQVHLLMSRCGSSNLCVFNTHLYYKPHAQLIRFLQVAIAVNHLRSVLDESSKSYSLIMCGDYNSLPDDAPLITYLTDSKFSSPELEQVPLKCPFDLNNSSGTPPFTAFTEHFKGTLDYIFTDKSFTRESTVPLPEEDELSLYRGLPSIVCPSDHLPIIVDLKWNPE